MQIFAPIYNRTAREVIHEFYRNRKLKVAHRAVQEYDLDTRARLKASGAGFASQAKIVAVETEGAELACRNKMKQKKPRPGQRENSAGNPKCFIAPVTPAN